MVLDEAVDPSGQLGNGLEGAAPDGPLGDDAEPALDLVELGGVGRRVVDVVARPAVQPRLHLGVLVGGVVVHHQVHVEAFGDAAVDVAQEGEELLVPCRA